MNVIWVVSDTLRRDHVGAYGNKTIRTPSMDDFAGKSIQFNRHYIAGFPTMPTRADHLGDHGQQTRHRSGVVLLALGRTHGHSLGSLPAGIDGGWLFHVARFNGLRR